jgi:hypothetical protein
MAKKTASRGRAKTAKRAAPKRKKARRVAKSASKSRLKVRKIRMKAAKPAAPEAAKTSNQAQVKDELREKFVMDQGNAAFEDYFSSGSEHFGV